MSQALLTYSLTAPGFQGLNTQESPLDLSLGFALVAQNAIIDQYGRIGSRKGWQKVNSSSGALGANDVTVINELVQADGTLTVLFAGNLKLFKLDSSMIANKPCNTCNQYFHYTASISFSTFSPCSGSLSFKKKCTK